VAERQRRSGDLGDERRHRHWRRQSRESGPSWHLKGSGDFNGDGFSDVLWQNDDGSVAIWEINGTTITGAAVVGNPGPSWHAKGSGDLNGDGRADILWQNSRGAVAVWEMNGASVLAAAVIANPGPTWHA
jgi:hypothetical protein